MTPERVAQLREARDPDGGGAMTREELLRELSRTDERPVPPGVVVPPPGLREYRAPRRWEPGPWTVAALAVAFWAGLLLIAWLAWPP
jgi:hypothetical protein